MKRKPSRSYDERYRYKLNMLDPGTVMLRICAVLAATGGLCFGLSWPNSGNHSVHAGVLAFAGSTWFNLHRASSGSGAE